jgi:hypothetical protein
MSFGPREYLRHILTEADFLVEAARDLTLERFEEDATLQRAFLRSLEVIGELPRSSLRSTDPSTRRSIGEAWLGCETPSVGEYPCGRYTSSSIFAAYRRPSSR